MLRTMSIGLIVGPPNSGRAGEIRARLEAALDRDPVLVVPTLDDADQFERELSAGDAAVVGASIRTFRAFSEEIAAATGAALRPSSRMRSASPWSAPRCVRPASGRSATRPPEPDSHRRSTA